MAEYMPHWHYNRPSHWCSAGGDESAHTCGVLMCSRYSDILAVNPCDKEMFPRVRTIKVRLFTSMINCAYNCILILFLYNPGSIMYMHVM